MPSTPNAIILLQICVHKTSVVYKLYNKDFEAILNFENLQYCGMYAGEIHRPHDHPVEKQDLVSSHWISEYSE